MSRFSSDLFYSGEVTARSFELLPGFDAAEMAVAEPDWVAAVFLSRMKIAGRDLPEGAPWMVDEAERISEADYDVIAEEELIEEEPLFINFEDEANEPL